MPIHVCIVVGTIVCVSGILFQERGSWLIGVKTRHRLSVVMCEFIKLFTREKLSQTKMNWTKNRKFNYFPRYFPEKWARLIFTFHRPLLRFEISRGVRVSISRTQLRKFSKILINKKIFLRFFFFLVKCGNFILRIFKNASHVLVRRFCKLENIISS